jgi:hypothetical protein
LTIWVLGDENDKQVSLFYFLLGIGILDGGMNGEGIPTNALSVIFGGLFSESMDAFFDRISSAWIS